MPFGRGRLSGSSGLPHGPTPASGKRTPELERTCSSGRVKIQVAAQTCKYRDHTAPYVVNNTGAKNSPERLALRAVEASCPPHDPSNWGAAPSDIGYRILERLRLKKKRRARVRVGNPAEAGSPALTRRARRVPLMPFAADPRKRPGSPIFLSKPSANHSPISRSPIPNGVGMMRMWVEIAIARNRSMVGWNSIWPGMVTLESSRCQQEDRPRDEYKIIPAFVLSVDSPSRRVNMRQGWFWQASSHLRFLAASTSVTMDYPATSDVEWFLMLAWDAVSKLIYGILSTWGMRNHGDWDVACR